MGRWRLKAGEQDYVPRVARVARQLIAQRLQTRDGFYTDYTRRPRVAVDRHVAVLVHLNVADLGEERRGRGCEGHNNRGHARIHFARCHSLPFDNFGFL